MNVSEIRVPNEFLRGIPNKDFIRDGHVLPTAFQFDDQQRPDQMVEASINWLDNDDAIEVTLNQRKDDGTLQFKAGVARVNLEKVNLFLESFKESYSYERNPINGNNYHGNLLIKKEIYTDKKNKQERDLILAGLALAAGTNIIPQDNSQLPSAKPVA